MHLRDHLRASSLLLGATLSAIGCSSSSTEPPAATCNGTVSSALRVCNTGDKVLGIDVSRWQGVVDWNAVKGGGYRFAFARVSNGIENIDEQFAANWPGMKAAGILRGPYQYFRPALDPIAQADVLLTKIAEAGGLEPTDLPPVIDLETDDGLEASKVALAAKLWLEHVEAALHRRPIIYTGSRWQTVTQNIFSGYPLWVPHYETECPNTPMGWTDWAIWQYSEKGTTPGIQGAVDLDQFKGSEAQLLAFVKSTNVDENDAGLVAPIDPDPGTTTADAGTKTPDSTPPPSSPAPNPCL
ncbi:Lyzozyme M1 (1,4-beta-N-acetylmuramidase) [Labilithrix luteola]|uniref:Lyzozyme M1 (1,4-beta-N-acetylmuramidase) n=1 Tax=Labilithrix luteola TaxID=1391654 RepID=A0A0K1QC90_9BACT|nr:GH25 family lysozyme [Labilithrix luteola]AKV03364.1 Lyzozyme M1 (1,4-beta-N-acetylmuramidase) [Labilithrix luteola]